MFPFPILTLKNFFTIFIYDSSEIKYMSLQRINVVVLIWSLTLVKPKSVLWIVKWNIYNYLHQLDYYLVSYVSTILNGCIQMLHSDRMEKLFQHRRGTNISFQKNLRQNPEAFYTYWMTFWMYVGFSESGPERVNIY